MAKYDPLHAFLLDYHGDEITLQFEKLEQILESELPPSAHHYRAWWENAPDEHVQALAWLDAGWEVEEVDLGEKWARFVRSG